MNLRPLLYIAGIFCFIFLCACTHKNSSPESPAATRQDSAYLYFEKGKAAGDIREKLNNFNLALKNIVITNDSLIQDILDYKIYYHNRLKEYDSALYFSDSLINTSKTQHDTASFAKGYYRKAKTFLYLDKHEQVLENMYRSQILYKSLGDSIKVGRRLVELANAQDRLGDFTGSHQSATEALKFLPGKDSTYLASTHTLLALTSSKLQDYDTSIKENKKALRYINATKDSLIVFNNLAINYRRNGNYSKSNEILAESLNKAEAESEIALLLTDNYFYNLHLQSGKKVEQPLREIAEQREKLDDTEGLINSYRHLSFIYKSTSPVKSKEFAQKHLNAARDFGNPIEELEALQTLISLEAGKSKYTEEYFRINDSINHARNKIKNVFAKIKYNEEEKLKEIDELETLTSLQFIEKEQMQNRIIILSLGGLLIIISSGFGFYYLKQRHEKEKIQEAHLTETRISKKIHDELANDVYNVMSGMQQLAPEPIMDKLENIYKRTRNISRENSSIPINENYLPHLVASLSAAVSGNTRLILRGEESIQWGRLSHEKKIVLYRVLQEMLINMNKHSKASLVAIIFSEERNLLKIQYTDNGLGVSKETLKSGNGIQNMENRIFSVKGSLNFETEKEKGLKILIQIPV